MKQVLCRFERFLNILKNEIFAGFTEGNYKILETFAGFAEGNYEILETFAGFAERNYEIRETFHPWKLNTIPMLVKYHQPYVREYFAGYNPQDFFKQS